MQYNINVANGTGMEVRTNLNLAHQSLATNFFGATDPSLMSPVCAFPGSTWADTGNGLLKVRKADNSDWIVIGTIKSDGTPKLGETAINTSELPMFNKMDNINTSGTYIAPVTGWYKITAKGGGGGGGGAYTTGGYYFSGAGGGEGGTGIRYIRMTAGDTVAVTIGAGGTGGASGAATGANGGDTSVVYNGISTTGMGGNGGANAGMGGNGGSGKSIIGATGGSSICIGTNNISVRGGNGGGNGGGGKNVNSGSTGGGGAGGEYLSSGTAHAGYNGGNGYVWFEYFDSTLNP